jgi:hypothetical protein
MPVVMTCETYKTPSFVILALYFSGFKFNPRIKCVHPGIQFAPHYRSPKFHTLDAPSIVIYSLYDFSTYCISGSSYHGFSFKRTVTLLYDFTSVKCSCRTSNNERYSSQPIYFEHTTTQYLATSKKNN